MRSVHLLATGGTVSTVTDGDGRSSPALAGRVLAALVDVPGVSIVPRELARLPSWALDPRAMAEVALAARDAARAPGVTGVVVTHGTTTLEYTAFLTHLVADGPVPIVFTGAMRRADAPDADGPANLADAVRVAAAPEARNVGVVVVLAGRIIAARHAWKARRTDVDAFVGLDGSLGAVRAEAVEIVRAPTAHRPFSGRLDDRVGFVKAVPGAGGGMVRAATGGDTRGLVVEGLPGVGGIPPGMLSSIIEVARRMPVVIASRAPYGRLPEAPTGGTGEPLRDADLLSAGELTAEQAWLLLMAALADGEDPEDVRRRYREAAGPLAPATPSATAAMEEV